MLLERGDRYRVLTLPTFELERPASREQREAALDEAMRRIAGVLETAIGPNPDQWFTFTDAWK